MDPVIYPVTSTEKGTDQGTVPAITMPKPLKTWNVKKPRTYAEAMASPHKKE